MEIQVKPENATRMAPLDWTPAMRLETYSLMAKHVPGALCYTRSCLFTNPVKSFIRECGRPWCVQLLPQTAQGVADTLPKEPPSQVGHQLVNVQTQSNSLEVIEYLKG